VRGRAIAIDDWKILLDVVTISKIDPWKVDLVKLLQRLEEALLRLEINVRLAGVAVQSAAQIHLAKSKRLFEIASPETRHEKPNLIVPPPIDIPVKSSLLATTLLDVVNALRSVILGLEESKKETKFEQINIDIRLDDYLLKIEEELDSFIAQLDSMLGEGTITFSRLVSGMSRTDRARVFILMLFAASRGFVELYQDEETLDIVIAKASQSAQA
jgi:chromatin segregation and condensation protein Rec8/ScpA/Scc1 (kleisin family)